MLKTQIFCSPLTVLCEHHCWLALLLGMQKAMKGNWIQGWRLSSFPGISSLGKTLEFIWLYLNWISASDSFEGYCTSLKLQRDGHFPLSYWPGCSLSFSIDGFDMFWQALAAHEALRWWTLPHGWTVPAIYQAMNFVVCRLHAFVVQ